MMKKLPEWITFNPQSMTFEGIIPGDFSKKYLRVYIIATDKSNASIKSSFVLFVLNTSGVKNEVDISSKIVFDRMNNCIKLNLSDISDKNICVRIYNISGRLVYSQNSISCNQLEINASQFKTGIYVINIFNKNQNFSGKIAIY